MMWFGLLIIGLFFNGDALGLKARRQEVSRGPMFIKEPPDKVDFSNTTGAWIDCQVQGEPAPRISWVRSDGGGRLDDVPHLRIAYPNGTLHFLPFRAENYRQDIHASVYRCVATNPSGTAVSRHVRVRAVVKQAYDANVYGDYVIHQNTAVLRCHIPSFVQDYVIVTAWIRQKENDTHSVINNGGRYSVFPSGALHIRDAGKDDEHWYKCQTKHILTKEVKMSASAGKLIATDPQSGVPTRLLHHIPNIEVEQGSSVEVPCAAQGFPTPQYTWWKVKGSKKELVRKGGRFEQRSGSLFIHRVLIGDEATYVCEANNTQNTVRAETVLSVTAPLAAILQPSIQQIDVGQSMNMTCTTSGYPITSVEWLKDGARLMPNNIRVRLLSPSEQLKIDSFQRDDRGIYQCFVKNKVASAQATTEVRLGEAMPVFHETFHEKVHQKGTSISLKCVIYGNPIPQVSWVLDGLPLPKTPRYHVQEFINERSDVISYVNISNLSTEDGGEYSCAGNNTKGKAEFSARIDVHGPPFIRSIPNITAIAGETMLIRCRTSGYPIHTITWERDGNQLPINHRQKILPNGTLEVDNLERPTDEGPYTCIAKNHHGETARRTVFVNLLSAPAIIPFSFPDNLREGMRAGITCLITDGDLPIAIQWLKDGLPITSQTDVSTSTPNEFTSSLAINNIRTRNNGNYTCVATNAAASVNFSTQLLVNVPPRWSIEPRDSNVTLGGTVILDCQADGFPSPTVAWKKRLGNGLGDYASINYLDHRIYAATNGSLILTNGQEENEGHYLCQSSNGVGSGLSKLIFLKVHVPARFDARRKSEVARKGSSAKLLCEARGDSPLIVTWRKNESTIDLHQDPRISVKETVTATRKKSELVIHKTERVDHAEFSCGARNNFGSDTMTISLSIIEKPEAPKKLNVGRKTSRTVELSWDVPFDGNNPIMNYKYQYKPTRRDWWNHNDYTGVVNGSITSMIVSGLLPAVSYNFRIAAENSVGLSNYTESVAVTTLEEVPSGPPLAVKVDALTSQSLRASWKSPRTETWNGDLEGYRVGYRSLDSSETYTFLTKDHRGADHEVILNDLKKFAKYGVIIEAYNRMGAGPRSAEVTAYTMEDTPTYPPQDVRCTTQSSSTIKVEWIPPPMEFTHGPLLGYKVYYASTDHSTETREPKSTSSTLIRLDSLEPFTNYSMRVLSFTRAGDGIRSKAQYCKTEEDAPSEPADIKTSVMSSDAILVSWRPPRHPNGNVTKYTVYMRGGHMERLLDHSLPPTEFTFEARGLKEDYQYEFWVTASTFAGEGKRSRPVIASPQPTVPAKIGSFSEKHIVNRKNDVRLPCRAVGIPTPDRHWKLHGKRLEESIRYRIIADGSLIISNVKANDSGNYSCYVFNIYAADEVFHELLVKGKDDKQSKPSSPIIKISNIGKTYFTVSWKVEDDGGSALLGFKLNFKSDIEYSEWTEVNIDSDKSHYNAKNLYCGNRYHVYMIAYNNIGSSASSNTEIINTKGFAPIVPLLESLLVPNRTAVLVKLEAWIEGGCHVKQFAIEIKQKGNHDWQLVGKEIPATQKQFIIRDLKANTTYELRVSAVSEAGNKTAEYDITTLSYYKDNSMTNVALEGKHHHVPFYFNLNIIIPIAVTMIVIIVVTATICDFMRRRQYRYPSRKSLVPKFKSSSHHGDQKAEDALQPNNQNYSSSHQKSSGPPDDVSPYATYQLPDCMGNEDGIPMKTFGHSGTPASVNPSHDSMAVSRDGKGLYSKVKKIKQATCQDRQRYPSLPVEAHSPFEDQRSYFYEKHKDQPPSREILRMHPFIESAATVVPSAPPAENDSVAADDTSPESDGGTLKFEQNTRTKPLHRVPDLLYHRPDSSSSNSCSSSPDAERSSTMTPERLRQSKSNHRWPSKKQTAWQESRGSSPDSGADEIVYNFNKPLGPPAGFTDSNKEPADVIGDSHQGPAKCQSTAVVQAETTSAETAKGIDSVRLAAAEEELIALLKRNA